MSEPLLEEMLGLASTVGSLTVRSTGTIRQAHAAPLPRARGANSSLAAGPSSMAREGPHPGGGQQVSKDGVPHRLPTLSLVTNLWTRRPALPHLRYGQEPESSLQLPPRG